MRDIRIAIVDDSAVIRRLVAGVVTGSDGLTVAGMAKNGREGIELIDKEKPDAVILDIEMPEMNGLEALVEIRNRWPKLPVVMFSTLAQHGASATVKALALGASGYVAKPSGRLSVSDTSKALRDEVAPLFHALCSDRGAPESGTEVTGDAIVDVSGVRCIVVGASTGGPVALGKFLGGLPGNYRIPVVVVQHMPPLFTQHLAKQLGEKIPLPVKIAENGDLLEDGGVWVAPGGCHTELEGGDILRIRMSDAPAVHSCRPSVDVLFESTAIAAPGAAVGVVLTGMGQDGLLGSQALARAGSSVLAQDSESSVVWGMPGAVVQAGVASRVGDPDALARALVNGRGSMGARVSNG